MFVSIIKLPFVVKLFLRVIDELSESVPLTNFKLPEISLSRLVDRLSVSIHEAIKKIATMKKRIFSGELNEPKSVLFISEKVTLVYVFERPNLNTITLSNNLFQRSLSDVLAYKNCVIEVADDNEVMNIFQVINHRLLGLVHLHFVFIVINWN